MPKIVLPNGIGMAQLGPSKGTACERAVIMWLRDKGLRVYANRRGLPGTPDAAIYSLKLAVFADGDFWHRPELMAARHKPHHKTNWTLKGKRGKRREYRANKRLKAMGWRVIRVWESSIKKRPEQTREKLYSLLNAPLARARRL